MYKWTLRNYHNNRHYGVQEKGQLTLLMPLPKVFFYDGFRRTPEMNSHAQLIQHAFPAEADKDTHRQLLRLEANIDSATPRQEVLDDPTTFTPTQHMLPKENLEELPEKIRTDWRRSLAQFAELHATYEPDQYIVANTRLLSALPCYWPLVCYQPFPLCPQTSLL